MSNTFFANFSIELGKQLGIWCELKFRKLLSQIMRRSSFIFRENRVSIEEEDKIVIVEEKLKGINIDGIGNLVDLPKLMFIDEKYGNFQVVDDSGELTRNDNRKKKSEVLQAYRCQLCGKYYRRDWGKHDFSGGYIFLWVGSKKIERKGTFTWTNE